MKNSVRRVSSRVKEGGNGGTPRVLTRYSVRGFTSGLLPVSLCSDDDDAGSLDILMEAPEGFRNSDEECFSESQVTRIARISPEARDATFCNPCCSSTGIERGGRPGFGGDGNAR